MQDTNPQVEKAADRAAKTLVSKGSDTGDRKMLSEEVRALRDEVRQMNNHRFIRLHDSLWKLGLFQLYRGLAFGLGSVLGATILVAVVVNMLSSIDFIPVIGSWAQEIIDQINAKPPTP